MQYVVLVKALMPQISYINPLIITELNNIRHRWKLLNSSWIQQVNVKADLHIERASEIAVRWSAL
jgi:hypothetical protein